MSELSKRVLVALPAAALLIFLAYLGGIYFRALFSLLAILVIWEMARMISKMGIRPLYLVIIALSVAILLYDLIPPEIALLIFLLAILAAVTAPFLGSDRSKQWIGSLFCGFYAPAGFLSVILLRNTLQNDAGFWLILALFLMIWGNDVFAYFGGKKFGKYPLAPSISPKKTWEGFWFGFLGAATGFLIVLAFFRQFPFSLFHAGSLVIIVSIAGPLGDLTASRLKRMAGVKDSSALIPGHGGFFDRFDAMILSAPFFYFYILLVS